jgi:geranylgeranyl reductase family protein
MNKTNVCIVGGGPAGSTTAKFLSEKGFKVVLIEKDKFPRDKPCGGGLTSRVLEGFNYVNNPSFIESYSYDGIGYSTSIKNKVEIHDDKPLVGMVLRKKFDFELAKLAVDQGTLLIDGKTVVDVKILEDKVQTILDDGSVIESDILVGADGVWSFVAKKTKLRTKPIEHGICILEEYQVDKETMDKYFGKSRTCHIHLRLQNINGYGWVFPKKEHLNIGIGEFIFKDEKPTDKQNLLKIYKEYITFLKKEKIIPESITIKKCKGGVLPLIPLKKTYSNRVILVGDAAGFISPISGEGIYYAMASGKIAANIISKALEIGDTSEQFLSKYQKIWEKEFGNDIKSLYNLRKKQRITGNEMLFKIANSDKKLSDMVAGIAIGNLSYHKYKWKIMRRYLVASLKYRISK